MYQTLQREECTREHIIAALADLRREWQENTPGSLLDVEASVGLLLSDLALALGLDAEERYQAFGPELYAELADALQPA